MPTAAPRTVFADPTGRRWRGIRRGGLLLGVVTTLLAGTVVAGVLAPPLLPALAERRLTDDGGLLAAPRLVVSRVARARLTARRRLYAALGRDTLAPLPRGGRRAARHAGAAGTIVPRPAMTAAAAASARLAPPVVAGFHVAWDDNSLAALRAHAGTLDWVIAEGAFVDTAGAVRPRVDRRLVATLGALPAAGRPRLYLMLSNYAAQTGRFATAPAARLVAEPAARRAAVTTLVDAARAAHAAGVVVDLEQLPDAATPALAAFCDTLRRALRTASGAPAEAADGAARVLVTVPADAPAATLRALAAGSDRVIAMLYDEHYGKGDPGPVASDGWFAAHARRVAAVVPPARLVLALGAYGYDWNDGEGRVRGEEVTFQDVMRSARRHGAAIHVDRGSRNPWVAWSDADSTDHVVWFLDAMTAANEARVAARLGAAGVAVWRLGAEDQAVWPAIRTALAGAPLARTAAALARVPAGYDVEFDGRGELLSVTARPTAGVRHVTLDAPADAIADERYAAWPTPWIVRRRGADAPHRVALTFDDGPDATWTPAILDTLRAHGAVATFFVVGRSVEAHLALLRRIVAEGHEIGNHTFTHPDLSRESPFVTRLELDANERLLEAALARRTALFRAPYFGDAEPTTPDELEPAWVASRLGYVNVGLRVDAQDWRPGMTAGAIVAHTLGERARGNVVLLHDGGGDRAATLAALGPLVDSLRARGDTLVPVSALIGLSAAEAMPVLPASSAALRWLELAAFGSVGVLDWLLHWLFLLAVALGVARLAVVLVLAALQRRGARRADRARAAAGAPPWRPAVSVLVPAYNEAKVIAATVRSLLAQRYDGPLEIVVVDDGSTDDTFAAATRAFAGDARVRVYHKPNGGKASALNFALQHASGALVVALDADTVFEPEAIAELVAPMADPRVGAVAGNAKVGNRVNLLTRWQAVEYVTSQNLERRAFALLDAITVVPGAVGAWRADVVRAEGGFTHDTLAEDQDLTLRVRRAGWRIAYAERAIAWTEAPETWGAFVKQRFRWSYGTLQCAWKHRDALFRARYGTLGWLALPNVWLFQLLLTALSPLADLLFAWSLVSVWLAGRAHGASYALLELRQVVVLYAVFLLVDWLAAVVGFLLEPGEERRLTWLVALQRFAYRQVMYAVVVRAFVAAVRGRVHGWGKLERTATVALPAARARRA